jgi:hypothetical protein
MKTRRKEFSKNGVRLSQEGGTKGNLTKKDNLMVEV